MGTTGTDPLFGCGINDNASEVDDGVTERQQRTIRISHTHAVSGIDDDAFDVADAIVDDEDDGVDSSVARSNMKGEMPIFMDTVTFASIPTAGHNDPSTPSKAYLKNRPFNVKNIPPIR